MMLQLAFYRTPPGEAEDSRFSGAKLEELFSIPLAAPVESIAVLRGRSSLQKDALLLTFRLVGLSGRYSSGCCIDAVRKCLAMTAKLKASLCNSDKLDLLLVWCVVSQHTLGSD